MEAAGLCSWMRGFLLPSLREAEVAVSAAALLLFFLEHAVQPSTKSSASSSSSLHTTPASCCRDGGGGCRRREKGKQAAAELGGTSKVPLPDGSSNSRDRTAYVIKLELLSAKYLIGANLNGSSDPYGVISCSEQRRFSSMVPSSRNPLWGEEFNFLVRELPAEVTITMYDWDIVCKYKVVGSVTVAVLGEEETGATWFDLDSRSGQICLRFSSTKVFLTSERLFDQCVGIESQRKMVLNKQYLPMTEDSGPLQAIFEPPHDEIVHQSYSCALERSFLHHGRMYISSWHLCFHSNVFSKQLNVIIPLQDIDEIKRSQHSLINPAITVFLHTGSGGHGTPPSCSQNGRVRYKFTTFWNRNRTFRAIENALKSYRETLEAEKQLRKWYPSDEYGGKIREVMFRSLCHSPLCPPDTAVTEWQRASFSKDKTNLIYETKHQVHDVPFGSYFEIHCRWSLRTTSSSTCQVDIKIGVNMKKWCILQSKIKSGATDEYRREVCKILEAACDYVLKEESNSQDNHEIVAISST